MIRQHVDAKLGFREFVIVMVTMKMVHVHSVNASCENGVTKVLGCQRRNLVD